MAAVKSGWVTLRYYSPSWTTYEPSGIINFVPGDMPLQYLYDHLGIGGINDPIRYTSIGDILTDGWEPYQTTREEGHMIHLFKIKVDYFPDSYQGPVPKREV